MENNTPALGKHIYTLAASGTAPKIAKKSKPEITVMGYGTDLRNIKTLEGRAKRKLITQTMALSLIQVARKNEDWKWEQRFSNTFLCQNQLTTAGGRSYSIYCKNRCCTICLAIRKAEKVCKYLAILENWPDPFFLTLTLQAVTKDELKARVDDIVKALRTIIARYKKRHQRGKEQKFMGIWSLECNYNGMAKTYNPHIHLILPNLYIADTIMREWRVYWQKKNVPITKYAQYNRRVRNDRKKELIEIVKYGSKIFSQPDVEGKSKEKKPSYIYVAALYNILQAMEKHNVFNTFGFTLPKSVKPRKKSTKLNEYEEWEYDLSAPDWINENINQRLANYRPTAEIEHLLENCIDTELE